MTPRSLASAPRSGFDRRPLARRGRSRDRGGDRRGDRRCPTRRDCRVRRRQPARAAAWGIERSIATLTSMTLDRLGRPLRDLRISVTDRCNFRCVYCMPKEVFGSDYRFLDRKELLTFEEIERVARVFVGLGVEKMRLTGGEPLVRKDVERLIALLAPLGAGADADDERVAPRAEGRALAAAGLDRVTVSLDSLDDDAFRAHERRRLPRSARARRDRRGGSGGVAREGERGCQARGERGLDPRDGGALPRRRHTLRFIEYMDVGHTNGWRLDDVVPAARSCERSARSSRSSRSIRTTAAKSRGAGATRRRRRGRRDRLGDTAVLRRLHAGADLGRGPSLHLPLRRFAATTCARCSRRRVRRRARRGDRRRLEQPHRPLLRVRSGRPSSCRRWR